MVKKRVVITGLGVFCGTGKNVAQFSDALLNGRSGIAPLDLFDVSAFPSRIGCQVKGYDPLDHFDRKAARKLSRADQFGLIAAAEALADSGVAGHYSPFDMGVSMGGGAAGMFQSEQWLKSLLCRKECAAGAAARCAARQDCHRDSTRL